MARPPSAPSPSVSGATAKGRSNAFLYVLIAAMVSFAIIPTIVVLSVMMLPTAVAFLIERGKGYYAVVTIGSLNLAGTSPYLVELWFKDHTVDGAMDVITNIWAYLIVYSAAGFGWAVYSTMPAVVASFMAMGAGRRIAALREQQKDLVQKWGPDVESVYEGDKPLAGQPAAAKPAAPKPAAPIPAKTLD
ncbi:MAG: hypothetical protein SFV19_18310 [Rhodospirillaceae bacterium]|nr:hypothetical protein [Rhodospirillaceae bacterium]